MSAAIITQRLTVACECGAVHCVPDAQHYDRVMAKCGRKYWVLQPKRNGELKLFPWPGPALTRAEMKAREEAEK